MTDTLHALQFEFAQHYARLIQQSRVLGYEVTLGDTHRSREECIRLGHEDSNHFLRLAGDLNLFEHGEYLTQTMDHQRLGEWWYRQHRLARWGGEWGDGNHYSFEWQGRK